MDMTLKNELFEMNDDELVGIEGGAIGTGVIITLLVLAPVPVATVVAAAGVCYGAGYAVGKAIAHITS